MNFVPAARMRRRIAALLAALAIAVGAGAAAAAPRSAADRETVARVEAWLNDMRTMRSPFVQTSSSGGIAEGTVWLERPGKMRIDYRPPNPLQIYTQGMWLVYVDTELEEVNQVPLRSTPAAYLVRDRIALSGDVEVEQVTRRRGTVSVHLSRTDESDAGKLIVTFAERPLSLRGWTVVDAQGVETTVTLIGPTINTAIEPDVFDFPTPDWAPRQQQE